ncbi:hypothetical protein SBV1_40011 [Verrucomicrobia bacterium]|nr:hypothetical protein SBV1_40011 [Verrucomicrobiota bacterium]
MFWFDPSLDPSLLPLSHQAENPNSELELSKTQSQGFALSFARLWSANKYLKS